MRKPFNTRSCVLDSFAYVMGLDPIELAREVGHDGPEGYHSQELIEVAVQHGWSVTLIERKPVAQNPETGAIRLIEIKNDADRRFGWHLHRTIGVLLGRTSYNNKPHAVAWNSPKAVDSSIGLTYPILDNYGRPDDHNFIPMNYLMMELT